MFDAAVGRTPLMPLTVRRDDLSRVVGLKLESANPTGSAKDRTALAILQAMHLERPLRPGDVVVESTSGNLGLALARLLTGAGCRLIVVTDVNTPRETRHALATAGAEVVVVNEPDGTGGYLLNRLRAVRELCAANPGYRWSNQYENLANPRAHEWTTGPEILAQAGPELDAVYIAVSTGGTLAGVSRYLRATAPHVQIVAVDAEGSLAICRRPGRRLVPGIGASQPSRFLLPETYDAVRIVSDARSFAACRVLCERTGLAVGGSSGSVLSALLTDLLGQRPPRAPVCLLPDGGERYLNAFYRDAWLLERNVFDAVQQAEKELSETGWYFTLGQAT